MGEWMVSGRNFRTKTDYEAAKSAAEYIEQIKRRYNLSKREGYEQLLQDLQSKKYRFRTILGADFEDNIEEKLKNFGKGSGTSKAKPKKNVGAKRKKKISLDDYDKNMQQIIRAEMKKQERRRKFMLASCVCVALVCFGYLGHYYYEAYRSDAAYNELAALK